MADSYYLKLGKTVDDTAACFTQGYIQIDPRLPIDVSADLSLEWKLFNEKYRSKYLELHPEYTKVGAGLACGALWMFGAGLQVGSLVLCRDGEKRYRLAEVTGPYRYVEGRDYPHQRSVNWIGPTYALEELPESLQKPVIFPGTICEIPKGPLQLLLSGDRVSSLYMHDESIVDPSAFAMEQHLEDFLVQNWKYTNLAARYDIYEVDGATVGQQFQTDAGPIDILAISKDKSELLVIELKKGRARDAVVGQILRYMGYVKAELAEAGQTVKGLIIAHEDDQKLRWALSAVQNIEFYRYEVSFKLLPS